MGIKEVAAGAAWLDENFPGWEREIDLGTFQLDDCHECICGQSLRKFAEEQHIFSGYDYALRGRTTRWAEGHGFTILFHDGVDTQEAWYSTEVMWRELIKERFSSGNLSDNG